MIEIMDKDGFILGSFYCGELDGNAAIYLYSKAAEIARVIGGSVRVTAWNKDSLALIR